MDLVLTLYINEYREVLSELEAVGASWIQLDETQLVMDLQPHHLEAFVKAYNYLDGATSGAKLLVETYFADIPVETYKYGFVLLC